MDQSLKPEAKMATSNVTTAGTQTLTHQESSASNGSSASSASNGNTPAAASATTNSTSSSASVPATSSSATTQDDSLVCRWNACGERFAAAEPLYVSSGLHLANAHLHDPVTNAPLGPHL